MTRAIKFNMNDTVRVKLTDHGRRLHRLHFEHLFSDYRGVAYTYYGPKEDAGGWSEWRLWELVSIFGKHIYMGGENVFETNIELVMDD